MSINYQFDLHRYYFSIEKLNEIGKNFYASGNWPLVYILSDERKQIAYVGETADALTRMTAHLKSGHKSQLTKVHLISSEKFNKSATLDIESNLIQYLSADEKFALLNGNLGMVDHNYYQKNELYSGIFREIWDKLRAEGLVKHSLEHLNNSDLFKYSPYKSLSFDQRQSLLGIMYGLLNEEKRNLIIQGGAGTGKSILAIFLFKLLQTDGNDINFREFSNEEEEIRELLIKLKQYYGKPRMALVVPMASFRNTLKRSFSNISGLKKDMVISPSELTKEHYDIVIVDEAHRLRQRVNLGAYYGAFDKASSALGLDKNSCSEVDWVITQSKKAVFLYDEDQSIKPSDTSPEVFRKILSSPDSEVQELLSQFRVRAGKSYVNFIEGLLNIKLNDPTAYAPKNYELKLFYSIEDFVQAIKSKDDELGLSRMIAGYSWPWISKKDSSAFDINIERTRLRWNSTNNDWINLDCAVNEVGCIHTTQGYDLNYAGIIFGNEIGYDKERNEIIVREDQYFDRNGKQSIRDPARLKQFILNIYKTILLRGIRGTFVYACDSDLRDYLARYIPVVEPAPKVVNLPPKAIKPFVNAVPFLDLRAAAGSFSEQQHVEQTDWLFVPEDVHINEDMFACKVVGESMNRIIPNGAVCLFRKDRGGSRNGKIVLVEHLDIMDSESGSNYNVKEYQSIKSEQEDGWIHDRILLKPRSTDPSYQTLVLEEDALSQYCVVGEFVQVLES